MSTNIREGHKLGSNLERVQNKARIKLTTYLLNNTIYEKGVRILSIPEDR